uniref:Uncharacterized protein n=1 Tax=Clastoptera arizonana TaxID=38151 RepID=A0A1B6CIQ8_9HEMI
MSGYPAIIPSRMKVLPEDFNFVMCNISAESIRVANEMHNNCYPYKSEVTKEGQINVINYQLENPQKKESEPVSDLGKALLDTISKVIYDDEQFKAENKVELILQIEFIKSDPQPTKIKPKNSTVKITIIPHKLLSTKRMLNPTQYKIRRPLPYRAVNGSNDSETASTKRRTWFERVVYDTSLNNSKYGGCGDYKCSTINYFNTRLFEDNAHNRNYSLQRQKKISDEMENKEKTPLSLGFLPASKANKSREVELALSELKRKVNYLLHDKNTMKAIKKEEDHIPSIGNLVSNILVGVIDKCSIPSTPTEKSLDKCNQVLNDKPKPEGKDNEMLKPDNFKNQPKENKSIINSKNGKMSKDAKSRKVHLKSKHTKNENPVTKGKVLQNNLSDNDLKINSQNDLLKQAIPKVELDETEIIKGENRLNQVQFKEIKSNTIKDNKKKAFENAKRKRKTHNHTSRRNKNRSLAKKEAKDDWIIDGKSFKLGIDLKKRVEELILNELQSIGLKHSMEYDLSSLPETSDTDSSYDLENSKSEVRSYICEVDLSPEDIDKWYENKVSMKEIIGGRVAENKAFNYPNLSSSTNNEKHSTDTVRTLCSKNDDELYKKKYNFLYPEKNIRKWNHSSECNKQLVKQSYNLDSTRKKLLNEEYYNKGFIKQLHPNDISKNKPFESSEAVSAENVDILKNKETASEGNRTRNSYFTDCEIQLDPVYLEEMLKNVKTTSGGSNDKFIVKAKRKVHHKNHKSNNLLNDDNKNSVLYTDSVLNGVVQKLENIKIHGKKHRNKK